LSTPPTIRTQRLPVSAPCDIHQIENELIKLGEDPRSFDDSVGKLRQDFLGLRLFYFVEVTVAELSEKFFTPEEVWETLRFPTKKALYWAIEQKKFPHVKVGRKILIPESLLNQWIAGQNAQFIKSNSEQIPDR
jgi:excisionase family DNA binding protein